jgi:hypothetical protein
MVAEERVGGQTVGKRLGDPRWRHRTGLAQHTLRLRTWYALRSHIALGRSRYKGHGHGLLVKIWSRSPRRHSFEVTAAQLACDVHRIRVAAVWRVAADV